METFSYQISFKRKVEKKLQMTWTCETLTIGPVTVPDERKCLGVKDYVRMSGSEGKGWLQR